ncbi:MAG: hypothetical protein ACI8TQ_001478 [Planctomycetota bacterium]|jgi:hypothetical protein
MNNIHTVGALYLIAERSLGKEFFLGRATGESDAQHLSLEGKALLPDDAGEMTVQPFATRAEYRMDDSNYRIQRVDHPDAVDEVTRVLTLAIAGITRDSFPLLARWFSNEAHKPSQEVTSASTTPFQHLHTEFRESTARFRKAMILSPQVTSAHELDRLAELEGDMVIEIGKVTNRIATSLNRMLENENRLAHFLRRVGDPSQIATSKFNELSGWRLTSSRLSAAKNWAVSSAATELVRELSGLIQEGNGTIGKILLEHQGALDALASEAFGRYGIQPHTIEPNVAGMTVDSQY